jgi:hypothetical protein
MVTRLAAWFGPPCNATFHFQTSLQLLYLRLSHTGDRTRQIAAMMMLVHPGASSQRGRGITPLGPQSFLRRIQGSHARPRPSDGRAVRLVRLQYHPINTPGTTAREHKIEKDEAIEDGQVAAVQRRVERLRRMRNEIGEPHLAGHDKRRPTRE